MGHQASQPDIRTSIRRSRLALTGLLAALWVSAAHGRSPSSATAACAATQSSR